MSALAALLRESWAHVEQRGDDVASQFYARMFLAEPCLRDLFPVAMREQRAKLLGSLVSIVALVDDPDRLTALLTPLGRDHRRFRVEPEHYGVVGEALIATLRHYCGERWSIEYDQAWRDAYDVIARTMLGCADRDDNRPPYWHAAVVRHERRGPDTAVITVRPLQPFTFRAGQYVAMENDYKAHEWRTYSIANAPRGDGTLEFHVRAPGHGWVSSSMVHQLRVGDRLRISPPMGSMTLDHSGDREIVCVADGTGLAPMKALVEELSRLGRTRWVHVFVGARDRDDFYDLPALQRLASRVPWLTVVPSCRDDPEYPGERGLVNDVVERFGPWPEHDFFVSGSPGMVRATLVTLAGLSVPAARINYDAIGSGSFP
jgi:NAD(P)H-flavin reductase/hemoglobin-like flavoprotein